MLAIGWLCFWPCIAQSFEVVPHAIAYEEDTVWLVQLSAKGEQDLAKPVFFFCQGSLPIPLQIHSPEGDFGITPFNPKPILNRYHLVIIGKPGIPLESDTRELDGQMCYRDPQTGQFPEGYLRNNHMDYYAMRNLFLLDWLGAQAWVAPQNWVVAGHSQGARIAVDMAAWDKRLTQVIYASGNPDGQMAAMLAAAEKRGKKTQEMKELKAYAAVIADESQGDPEDGQLKSDRSFSRSSLPAFSNVQVPVWVCIGTEDPSFKANKDLARKFRKQPSFTFRFYDGLSHNFFAVGPDGKEDWEQFHWDDIVVDWMGWLTEKK